MTCPPCREGRHLACVDRALTAVYRECDCGFCLGLRMDAENDREKVKEEG